MTFRPGPPGVVLLCAILLFAISAPGRATEVRQPEGYRLDNYRSAVPSSLAGGEVVDTVSVRRLLDTGGIALVDVLPRPPKPEGLLADDIWLPPDHQSIPGSVWLPNVGYGVLSDAMSDYFSRGMESLSRQHNGFLFFCRARCWMSWNAAKRALSMGYGNVYWYPGGTDDWLAAGYALEVIEPFDPGSR